MSIDVVALTNKYFEVWNAHDKPGITALHAPDSTLKDWAAEFSPTNEAVGEGIGGIWAGAPNIKIEIIDIFKCGESKTCVANITVVVGDDKGTKLNVVDVIEYDSAGLVVSLTAYLGTKGA